MSSHVQKCNFVSNFEILYIYVCFVYMLRAPSQSIKYICIKIKVLNYICAFVVNYLLV